MFPLRSGAGDPEDAIVRAVNDTSDNDTIAAILGAAMGALHGREALPERWMAGLSGRTGARTTAICSSRSAGRGARFTGGRTDRAVQMEADVLSKFTQRAE